MLLSMHRDYEYYLAWRDEPLPVVTAPPPEGMQNSVRCVPTGRPCT